MPRERVCGMGGSFFEGRICRRIYARLMEKRPIMLYSGGCVPTHCVIVYMANAEGGNHLLFFDAVGFLQATPASIGRNARVPYSKSGEVLGASNRSAPASPHKLSWRNFGGRALRRSLPIMIVKRIFRAGGFFSGKRSSSRLA